MLTNDYRRKNVSDEVNLFFLDQEQECVSLSSFILLFRSVVSPSALRAAVK